MHFMPIIRALLRNKTGAILIAAQIAVTMTVIVNAMHIIVDRNQLMSRSSGVDEANLFYLSSTGFADNFNEQQVIQADLLKIRNTPGVIDAYQSNSVPLRGGGWSMGLATQPGNAVDSTGVAIYFADEHAINTLGVELIAGENFKPEDISWRQRSETKWPDKVIITKAMAESLFPDDWQSAVGQTAYIAETQPVTIIGIINKLQAPWNGWSGVERSLLCPQHTLFGSTRYIIRTEPGMRDKLMPQIESMLADSQQGRILRGMRTMEETRERSYRGHRGTSVVLTTLIGALMVVTGLGIVGLASFSVNRRKKQIGTRRALGANRANILHYFMVENFIITSIGVSLGALMTLGLNMLLVDMLSLTPIRWFYVPCGMLALLFIGQLAVLGPARRASMVPPAIATRTA
ncbi:ABC transporter permease [Aliikangiella maris]|uniref:FtsX-like permease family protein n=2 Tax=Aliikangiella maris TaxID=3162458 RepID=A0ABV2BXK4_9GAMM